MESNVSEFYNKIQFPGLYTMKDIIKKSEDFFLAEYLDISYLPFKSKILDVGCGTGYTSHIIATIRRDIQLTGIDFSKKSLEFASNFSKQNNFHNTEFEFMDLRQINFEQNSFDVVHCSGVLHHIQNPKPIFEKLCKLLKKNGLLVIGLYHPWGRFQLHIRQKIFKVTKNKFRWIDPRIRNENWDETRKNIWFMDQYEHPFEEDYSHKKLRKWFEEENISVLGYLPKFTGNDLNYNLHMLMKTGSQGGLFILVGKK